MVVASNSNTKGPRFNSLCVQSFWLRFLVFFTSACYPQRLPSNCHWLPTNRHHLPSNRHRRAHWTLRGFFFHYGATCVGHADTTTVFACIGYLMQYTPRSICACTCKMCAGYRVKKARIWAHVRTGNRSSGTGGLCSANLAFCGALWHPIVSKNNHFFSHALVFFFLKFQKYCYRCHPMQETCQKVGVGSPHLCHVSSPFKSSLGGRSQRVHTIC